MFKSGSYLRRVFHVKKAEYYEIEHKITMLSKEVEFILSRVFTAILSILWFALVTVLILLPIGAFFLLTGYALDFYLIVYIAGLISTSIIYLLKKPTNLPHYRTQFRFSKKSRISFIIGTFLLLMIFLPVFLFSGVVKIHPPAPNAPTTTSPTNITIISYNIRYGRAVENNPANNWINRRDELVAYIDSFEPDILCVQEAYQFQLEYIKQNLQNNKYLYTVFGRNDGIHLGEHEAIFFKKNKYKFLDGDTFWLGDFPLLPIKTWEHSNIRASTWARFQDLSTGAQFMVFNTHYAVGRYYDTFHEKASSLIKQKISEYSGGLPIFLTGDFNMNNKTEAFQILLNQGIKLNDAFSGPETVSYNDWEVDISATCCRIDFILTSGLVQILNCSIPKDTYGIDDLVYSDHYPVIANCTF